MKRLLTILLVLSSCSVINKSSKSEPLHFFACNTWVDRNKDGIYDYYEFENIKSTFRASERILFVGFLKDLPAGTMLRFSLYAPDGDLFNGLTQVQLFNKSLIRSEYSVMDLISKKSTGAWTGVWDIDGEEVAEIMVKLVN